MKITKVLLYCTKRKPYLFKEDNGEFCLSYKPLVLDTLNGKIVAKCEVETEEISLSGYPYYEDCSVNLFNTPTLTNDELLCESGLSEEELENYLTSDKGYALYITNLELFEKPRFLNYFFKGKLGSENSFVEVARAPQNMMYVYTSFELPEIVETEYVLISIRPEWLCKILNGEKTIEVRKKVLKDMLPDE